MEGKRCNFLFLLISKNHVRTYQVKFFHSFNYNKKVNQSQILFLAEDVGKSSRCVAVKNLLHSLKINLNSFLFLPEGLNFRVLTFGRTDLQPPISTLYHSTIYSCKFRFFLRAKTAGAQSKGPHHAATLAFIAQIFPSFLRGGNWLGRPVAAENVILNLTSARPAVFKQI